MWVVYKRRSRWCRDNIIWTLADSGMWQIPVQTPECTHCIQASAENLHKCYIRPNFLGEKCYQEMRKKISKNFQLSAWRCQRSFISWSFHTTWMIQSVEHSCNRQKKKNGPVPFLPQEEVIPIMPFHIILKDNLRFIPPFSGRGPNLQKKPRG